MKGNYTFGVNFSRYKRRVPQLWEVMADCSSKFCFYSNFDHFYFS